jgi:hypothetical protein
MRRYLDAARRGPPRTIDEAERISREIAGRPRWLYQPLFVVTPAFEKVFVLDARCLAGLQTAHAALAAQRYRLANGELPDELNQLVPDYLDAVPADPFDGKPLRYAQRAEGGFVVYSVGSDETDDGGTRYDAAGEQYEPGTDITFEVLR